MRRIPVLSVLALVAAGFVAAEAEAQMGYRHSGQLSLLGASLFGDEFEGIDSGVGFEAQYRLTPGRWSIGVGFQYTSHDVDASAFDDIPDLRDLDFSLWGGFIEPRYVIDIGSDQMAPYVSGRLSILRESGSVDVPFDDGFGNVILVEFSAYANGLLANAGGGLLFALSPRVNLDVGLTVGFGRFGEGTLEVQGQEVATFDGTSGGNVVFRAGVSVGLGR